MICRDIFILILTILLLMILLFH